MIRCSSIRACRSGLLAAVSIGFTAITLSAQVEVGKPIRVNVPKPKVVKFHGEVLHANVVQIIVRSREDGRFIRTFSYAPKAREAMEKVLNRGGYQYGDPVVVYYTAGSDVALKIKGKRSKPL